MIYKLRVSRDCGCTYFTEDSGQDLGWLVEQGKGFDGEGLRWVVEDEAENIIEVSAIHKSIITFMESVNK